MKPTRLRVSISWAFTGRSNSLASPSDAGNRPVSIFMVVVLPQPFEPRKPKNFSPLDAKAHMIDCRKTAEPHREAMRFDRRRALVCPAGRDCDGAVASTISLRGTSRTKASSSDPYVHATLQFRRAPCRKHLARVHGHQPVELLSLLVGWWPLTRSSPRAALPDPINEVPRPARQRINPGGRFIRINRSGSWINLTT